MWQVRVRPEEETAFSEVRVVGGENMMEERPVTEGLALFDTGIRVRPAHAWGACFRHMQGLHASQG